jgi:hypothetical protein
MSKRFSVRKAENNAIRAATAIRTLIDSADNKKDALVSFLAGNTKMTWFRAVQMVNGLGRLRTPFDALRAGFAIHSYPECFSENDNELDPPYLGDPIFPVHGRILDCCVSQIRGREVILMEFLAMNSILAGRVYKLWCSPYVIDKILRKIYSGRNPVPFIGISGCYLWLNSDLLFREIMKRDLSDSLGANSEEKDINKRLCKDRGDLERIRTCSEPKGVNCYACQVPRSECMLSTRKKRKQPNELSTENEANITGPDEQGVVGDVDSDKGLLKDGGECVGDIPCKH